MPQAAATDECMRVFRAADGNSSPRLLAQSHGCTRDVLERVDEVLDENLSERLNGSDTALFGEEFDDTPLAGFFSNGEISTSNGHSLLHGYTSTFAMFREREPARVVGDRRRADRAVD